MEVARLVDGELASLKEATPPVHGELAGPSKATPLLQQEEVEQRKVEHWPDATH